MVNGREPNREKYEIENNHGGKDGYVLVIGGVNVDMVGFPYRQLVLKDSNPGIVSVSFGGVGRNIAENLVKLGIPTKLISAFGDDQYGKKLMDDCRRIGLDIDDSLILSGTSTSVYFAVLDHHGEMQVAISDMDIYEKMTIEFMKEKNAVIEGAKICVIDTNIPRDVIEFMVTNFPEKPFYLDTVSSIKAMNVKDIMGSFHTIKPNKLEAEMLSGLSINDERDLSACANYFLNQGIQRVFISLGEKGIFYSGDQREQYIPSKPINVVNATGAGDAFIAALVYSHYYEYDIDFSARFAMAASALALSHEATINPNMSVEQVKQLMQ